MERISDEVAELTKSQVGSEFAMWASFQPIYDLMLEKDDSFLNQILKEAKLVLIALVLKTINM